MRSPPLLGARQRAPDWGFLSNMETNPSPYPVLKFLDEFSGIQMTRNRLPHWQQDRASYFLTFRLADSIPAELLVNWRREKELWLLNQPSPWSAESETEYHKRFSARIDQYLDQGHGSCLLREKANAEIVANTFRYFDHQRYILHQWVVMPNHVHVLLTVGDVVGLEHILASWKRFSALKINQRTQRSGALWQKDYFDRMIRDWDHFMNVARYIRRNPVKAKLGKGEYLLEEAAWINRLLA